MTLTQAKHAFGEIMRLARFRTLTIRERGILGKASQVIRYAKRTKRNPVSRRKARTILHEGVARGRVLTAKQRRFFGARASGYPVRKNPDIVSLGRAVEVRYRRNFGRAPGYYKHSIEGNAQVFTVPPGWVYLSEKSIVIASKVKRG